MVKRHVSEGNRTPQARHHWLRAPPRRDDRSASAGHDPALRGRTRTDPDDRPEPDSRYGNADTDRDPNRNANANTDANVRSAGPGGAGRAGAVDTSVGVPAGPAHNGAHARASTAHDDTAA